MGLLCISLTANNISAQDRLTREQILDMSIEQLSELPLEDLMQAVATLGVSNIDELFALIMNKNVSSASKTEEDSFTSPLSSTVITREEMRTYGISTIEEAFRLIPGMIVSEKYNGIYDVQMRGLNNIPDNNLLYYTDNMNVLLMIDGRISHNYGMGSPTMEFLPISIEDVERIEVVRGATSALYGPNAVNGVINIITNKPDQNNYAVEGSMQVGNNTSVGDVAFRQRINDKWAIGLTGNAQIRNRPTSDIYLLPSSSAYYTDDPSEIYKLGDMSKEEIGGLILSGKLTDYTQGKFISVEEYNNNLVSFAPNGDNYFAYPTRAVENDVNNSWKDPRISRRTYGVNGYITFNPNEKLRFDLTGGYQDAYIQNTSVGNDDNAPRGRKANTWYLNFNSSIYNLKLAADVCNGSYDFVVGGQGFKMKNSSVSQVQAEYDFNVGRLQIRPGVSYQMLYYKGETEYFDYGKGLEELCTFFGYERNGDDHTYMYDFAPNIRLDYKVGGARFIGAFREDKTRYPDKWNPSWQFSASYEINNNNFIRLVYGRSFRSAAFANTSSKYSWPRTDRGDPKEMQYLGNTESPLVHIDNYEIGYRWRPTEKILIDAEAFYSRSKDYGALKSYASMLVTKQDVLTGVLADLMPQIFQAIYSGGDMSSMNSSVAAAIGNAISTKSQFRYDEMPFKVSQYGVGLNLDWIISSKLIAKVNANFQHTTIDNYYKYSQTEMIEKQLKKSYEVSMTSLEELMTEIIGQSLGSGNPNKYLNDLFSTHTNVEPYKADYDARREALLNELLETYAKGETYGNGDNPLGLYYLLKYNIEYDAATNEYNIGSSVAENLELSDNHKHKATPDFYGMFGLIYKPIDKLTVSAFGNYQSKREYTTNYGVADVDPIFTMNLKLGYKPISNCEVFFNAHNLFNSQKREFIYTDKLEGIYTVGVNFAF